ncbi:MBOAT family protein [Phycisphaerales bacterium AB-hyl4]|uniref:MBOAT family protein n=1 Tax=Natronomicrosphaera hydrolytica TaxID=3242702 RepID=A0ABV4U8Z2_9BACT
MLFQTWQFIVFFIIVYTLFLQVKGTRFQTPLLLAASYFFYGWWNPLYLLLIVYSTVLDYTVVQFMERSQRKRIWLAVSICNNLFLLGFFKYGEFFAENLNAAFQATGVPLDVPMADVLLPVGISFYTFQSMSYTIDFYRGEIRRERSFLRFAAFVSLFPQLVAGPIERARTFLPQFAREARITWTNISDGLTLFLIGFFKKVAIADYLAMHVDPVYAYPDEHSGSALLLATFFFGWQIYFDFSGYTDMARGIARMMGFNLMLNFNRPYLANSLGDFWGRWHISLSSWFKDYVYIPLGGNRRGTVHMYMNMFLVMVISGLWHGAAWTFVIWGAMHAIGRIVTRPMEQTAFYREQVPNIVKQAWVFAFVTVTWIFFRAESLGDAWLILGRIFSPSLFTASELPHLAFFFCMVIWIYQYLDETRARFALQPSFVRIGAATCMIVYVLVFLISGTPEQAFIYFQF